MAIVAAGDPCGSTLSADLNERCTQHASIRACVRGGIDTSTPAAPGGLRSGGSARRWHRRCRHRHARSSQQAPQSHHGSIPVPPGGATARGLRHRPCRHSRGRRKLRRGWAGAGLQPRARRRALPAMARGSSDGPSRCPNRLPMRRNKRQGNSTSPKPYTSRSNINNAYVKVLRRTVAL